MGASYGDLGMKIMHGGVANSGYPTAIAVEAGTGDITGGLWDVHTPMVIRRLGILVTVAFDYNVQVAEGVVTFFRRITYGSNTGRVTLGTVRLIDATAAGRILYRDINEVFANVGDQIVAAITTAGTGGGAIAGDFLPEFYYDEVPEALGNQTRWVAGA